MTLFKKKLKTPARDHTPGEVRYNPDWRKANMPPARKPLPTLTPEPLTRQIKRQMKRRAEKQPLDMSQQKWHDLNKLGKVQPFRSSPRASRAPLEI